MNAIEIHLGLNHFPVIGLILFLPIYLYAIWKNNGPLLRLSLVMFFILGIISLVVHTSGENAEELVEHNLQVSHDKIHEHEEWGEKAYMLCAITGFLSVLTLVLRWGYESWKRWIFIGILALGIGSTVLMFLAASSGGRIRHPELEMEMTE